MKRILSLVLCALMLASMLVSCGGDPAVTTGAPVTEAPETTEPANDIPELPDPETLDITGEFHILVSGNMAMNDFQSESDEGTAVEIAIFRRNETLKAKYGVEITNKDVTKFGSTNGSGTGFVEAYTDYMAGDGLYDAALIGTYDVATLAYNGIIHDLNDIPHIDLSKAYWDQKANKDLSINGRMYYTTGEITTSDNVMTHTILFNKDLRAEYGLEDPYTLVRNGEWTLEKFGQLVKQVGEDVNQDGIYDANDRYGLLTFNDPMVAILAASGEKIASINEDGLIELTFYNERTVDLYDRFTALNFDMAHVYNYQYDNVRGVATALATWDVARDSIFSEGRALFYTNLFEAVDRHRDSETDFGILPYPKMDKDQEEYGHAVSAYHSQFICVPEMAKDHARSGIVLEELAYQGLRLLTPAYYEQTLIGKTVRDEESVDMLDIIFATRVFDVGQYYNVGTIKDQLGKIYVTRTPITSMYETYKTQAQTKIDMINKIMQDLQ